MCVCYCVCVCVQSTPRCSWPVIGCLLSLVYAHWWCQYVPTSGLNPVYQKATLTNHTTHKNENVSSENLFKGLLFSVSKCQLKLQCVLRVNYFWFSVSKHWGTFIKVFIVMMVLKPRNTILQSVHSLMEEKIVCQWICGSVNEFKCMTYNCEITQGSGGVCCTWEHSDKITCNHVSWDGTS